MNVLTEELYAKSHKITVVLASAGTSATGLLSTTLSLFSAPTDMKKQWTAGGQAGGEARLLLVPRLDPCGRCPGMSETVIQIFKDENLAVS